MKIRKAVKNDFEKLANLMIKADNRFEGWAKEAVRKSINKKDRLILVADDKANLVGFAGLRKKDENERIKKVDFNNYACITWIGVLQEHYRKGIGSKLLKSCEKYAKRWKKQGIWLDCVKRVAPFYERNGYKVVNSFIKEVKGKKRMQFAMIKELK
jgi:ribosomal protein S18 acetylase RimI-like enzyme